MQAMRLPLQLKVQFGGSDPACLLAYALFWRKFANLVKSGCVSRELTRTGKISALTSAGVNVPGYSKTGIRKSKTSRWRATALILLNLFMIAHIIQWRVMGKTEIGRASCRERA